MKISVSKFQSSIISFLFIVVVLFLTRQVPLANYSYIMNIALLLFFLFGIKGIISNIKKHMDAEIIFYINAILLLILVLYSLLLGNRPSLIARFYIIMFLIILAYYTNFNKKYVNIFLFFIFFQALFVIGIEVYLLFINSGAYMPLRFFIRSNDWGDVYKISGLLWKVQPRGNSLLPFAFFVSLVYLSGAKRNFFGAVFLIAIFFAGNVAFILGLFIFLFMYILFSIRWRYEKIVATAFVLIILGCITSIPVLRYIEETVKVKSEHSSPTRIDQTHVLMDDLSQDIKSTVLGRGLGNTISKKTSFRDYTDMVYYELQTLYVLNQAGVIYFSLFVLINILLAISLMKHKMLLAMYFSYIFYAFFNPYLMDTTHVVVIIILISLKETLDARQRKNICTHSCLQS
jgi:hypothetical protein